MPAVSILETFTEDLKREGFQPIDNVSVVLTHLSEVIRNNLPQLLSYKDVKMLIDRLDPEYKKLADEICTSHMSYSGLQAVLKLLLAERVSIRNLHLILEAVAELAPHVRKTEQIVEHVRVRMSQQLCGDLADNGMLRVLRLGNKWDMVFHQALKRDTKGDVVEFDIDPRSLEEFSEQATKVIREHHRPRPAFRPCQSPETRSYVRMIVERLFATLAGSLACRAGQRHRDKDLRLNFMITDPQGTVLALFAGFLPDWRLRPGMPGFSTARVPGSLRVLHCGRFSIAVLPVHWNTVYPQSAIRARPISGLIFSESLIGVMYGLLARLYMLGLQFAGKRSSP